MNRYLCAYISPQQEHIYDVMRGGDAVTAKDAAKNFFGLHHSDIDLRTVCVYEVPPYEDEAGRLWMQWRATAAMVAGTLYLRKQIGGFDAPEITNVEWINQTGTPSDTDFHVAVDLQAPGTRYKVIWGRINAAGFSVGHHQLIANNMDLEDARLLVAALGARARGEFNY